MATVKILDNPDVEVEKKIYNERYTSTLSVVAGKMNPTEKRISEIG